MYRQNQFSMKVKQGIEVMQFSEQNFLDDKHYSILLLALQSLDKIKK